MSDIDEQAWWVYDLPGDVVCYMPAKSEEDARGKLKSLAYKGAPVEQWPFIASRWTSRSALVKSILGRHNIGASDVS